MKSAKLQTIPNVQNQQRGFPFSGNPPFYFLAKSILRTSDSCYFYHDTLKSYCFSSLLSCKNIDFLTFLFYNGSVRR